MDILEIIGREKPLFNDDIDNNIELLNEKLSGSKCLVIGAAGSIGKSVTLEILKYNPKTLFAIDISENNLVELVRDVRSSPTNSTTDFKSFCIDCSSIEFEYFLNSQKGFDFVFNLSAMKHVRSERDKFTLMRLIEVNILNVIKMHEMLDANDLKKFFCVSTDKAANPVNMMGASKKIMEDFLISNSLSKNISLARFANVAFSDGSLLHGFRNRIEKFQPLSAPKDIKRYFITPKESGELCMMSAILGENNDLFFPKLREELHAISFSELAIRYLHSKGYEPYECDSEDEAKFRPHNLIKQKKWPCYFFESDTTGEKHLEEFFTDEERLDMNKYLNIGVIKLDNITDPEKLDNFRSTINKIKVKNKWSKEELVNLFLDTLPDFNHEEKNKNLDEKM